MRSALPARSAFLALAAVLASPSATRAANLLVNGSFETPDIPDSTYTGVSIPGWTGVAYLFDGGVNLGGWPASGASGPQYGDFGNGPAEVYQNFTVPNGYAIGSVAWSDASSAFFGGGSYTVSLLRLPGQTVVAQGVFTVAASSGGNVVPWTRRALTLPASLPGSGAYRLRFVGTGMTGSDYLVDDAVVEAGPSASTLAPAGGGFAPAQFFASGNTAYTRFADSPFAGLSFTSWQLENFEDHLLNTPGVSLDGSLILSSDFGTGLIDSVDADDGLVNGTNHNGAGIFGEAIWSGNGFRFVFDPAQPGGLPTHVGIVWTDGYGLVRLEAFDAGGESLGTVDGESLDTAITGETADDRFYGVAYAGGISAIRIWSPGGSAMEVDHLQYGRGPALPGGAPYAYAANAGWINFRPSAAEGVRVQARRLSGWGYAANVGWINFGSDSPGDQPHLNTAAGNTGVNRDPAGNLSGYAYAANAGWINFGWAAPDDPQRPRTDLNTGRFLGYAYAANLGWINLAAAGLSHDVALFPDTDLDGLPDSWEDTHFGNLADASAGSDYDGDGVPDLAEYQTGTDPRNLDNPAPARPSTVSGLAHHLYAANAGWIDARPSSRFGLRVGDYFLSGWLNAPNFGWIHVGDGSPANGYAYSNAGADDYGVNRDATGAFSGYAYGANVGWVNFGWAGPNDPNRPRVDLSTGVFSGCVYAANLGWISFVGPELRTTSIERPDSDADAMDDAWEQENFGDLSSAGPGTDADRDGQSDAAEYVAGTDPRDAGDFFRITSYSVVSEMTQIGVEFTSDESRRYRIEYTGNLATGPWLDSPFGEFAPDTGSRTTRGFTLPTTATARFFRVVAVLPLSP